jgi:hypothetical protein
MTLDKSDVQKYNKRLRKNSPNLRYFFVGEYGSKRYRPHYHGIVFNARKEDIFNAWTVNDNPFGTVHIGGVSGASIAYTLKYIMKPSRIPIHKNDDRVPEFRMMSKGLGDNYLTPQMIKYHKKDILKVFTTIEDGIKIPLPRFYRDKIFTDQEKATQNFLLKLKFQNKQKHEESKFNRSDSRRAGDYRKNQLEGAEYRNKRAFKKASDRKDL